MQAEFIGSTSGNNGWSNDSAWAGDQVPQSSDGLHVTVDAISTVDLGTAADPFVTNDVIAANLGLDLFVSRFMSVHDLSGFRNLSMDGSMTVRHDLVDVSNVFFGHGNEVLEVGHDIGATAFLFHGFEPGEPFGTLILDRPAHGSLDNELTASFTRHGFATVELGGLDFDGYNSSQNADGSTTIQLTEHGSSVYNLTNVHLTEGTTVSVGADPHTGYDFVKFGN